MYIFPLGFPHQTSLFISNVTHTHVTNDLSYLPISLSFQFHVQTGTLQTEVIEESTWFLRPTAAEAENKFVMMKDVPLKNGNLSANPKTTDNDIPPGPVTHSSPMPPPSGV